MKILTPEEMRAADEATFQRLAIPSRAVMESAGRHAADFLASQFPEWLPKGVLVLCGGGNNGGDGFVIARALLGIGVDVRVLSLKPVEELSGDVSANAEAYIQLGGTFSLLQIKDSEQPEFSSLIQSSGVVVDALFGTGLDRPLREDVAELLTTVNRVTSESGTPVFAVDIPSGVNAANGEVLGTALRAETTVALQCLKVGHVLFPGAEHCGETVCLDIGVPESLDEISSVSRELLLESSVAELVQKLFVSSETVHKGVRGHLLVVGGSDGHYGAPKLSGQAALGCGAGLVTLALPKSAARILGPESMELMCAALPDDGKGGFAGTSVEDLAELGEKKSAYVIGPGMGQGGGAQQLLELLLSARAEDSIPTVLDADALNIIADNPKLEAFLGPHVVLTPHPGEMARLTKLSIAEVESDRIGVATELAERLGCYVILKGARSIIASPTGEIWINPAAVATLATGGSGDVLAGVLGALLARGGVVSEAVRVAVFAHGAAGELCLHANGGEAGTLASDIARFSSLTLNALSAMPLFQHGFVRPALPGALQHLPEFLSFQDDSAN